YPAGQLDQVRGPASGGGVILARQLSAVFWIFPRDRKLAHLASMLRQVRALARRLGGPGSAASVVGYKPEKAAVIELRRPDGRPVAYAKLYKDDLVEQARRIHLSLSAQVGPEEVDLLLARPLASPHPQLFVLQAVRGTRIAELDGVEACAALGHLGTALAAFHALTPPSDSGDFTRHDPE